MQRVTPPPDARRLAPVFTWQPLAVLVWTCSILGLAAELYGQQSQEIREIIRDDGAKVDIDLAKMKAYRSQVQAMLRAGKTNSAEELQLFDDYYQYRVAELTWKENQTSLPKKREALKKQDIAISGRAPVPDLHDRLNSLLLSKLSQIALGDQFDPVARFNCMLMIGCLDQKEPDFRGTGAVPLPAGLSELLKVLDDQSQPEAIRVAALIGIDRHIKFGVAAPQRGNVVRRLLQLAGQVQPPEGTSKAGNDWMRRRSARGLGVVAAKWPEANLPETVQALYQLVSDTDSDLLSRCDAVHALGSLEARSYRGAPVDQMAKVVAELVVTISQAQRVPPQYLNYYLWCVSIGLNGTGANRGIKAASDGETNPFINELITTVRGMLAIASNRRLSDADKIIELRKMGQQLEGMLQENSGGDTATEPPVTVGSFPTAPN